MTRTTESRNLEKRTSTYSPPSMLDFPKEMLDHYHEKGQKLRWVRYSTAGEFDSINIIKYKQEGWQFVTKTELPDEIKDFYATTKIGTNNQVICQGDLVLAKIDAELSEARQKHYEQQSIDAVESTRQEARSTGGNRRIDELTPLIDETKEPTLTTRL